MSAPTIEQALPHIAQEVTNLRSVNFDGQHEREVNFSAGVELTYVIKNKLDY